MLAAALEIGGLLGGVNDKQRKALFACGLSLGRAYQVQDDWLGIWGDDALTGKSNQSDLIARKKSFPILLGVAKKQSFYKLWSETSAVTAEQISPLTNALVSDGIKTETEAQMESLYQETQSLLDSVGCLPEKVAPLRALLNKLMRRAQ